MNSKLRQILIKMSKICIYGIIVQLSIYSLAFAFDSKAQNKSVNDIQVKLDLKAPAQLESIFEEIEKTTDFHFSYVDEQLNSSMYTVNLETRKMILGDLLMDISQQTDLSFRRVNNNIFISKKRLGVERVVEVIETQKVIAGTVKDDRGEALPGATVQEKGTSNGTITDVEGNFTLNVPEQATLIVSFVGYETQEISVNNRSEIDIRLSEDAEQLAEVVVVGYGVQEKVNMTGAVGVVESKQLESRPVASVEEALQGQIPGLRIVRTSGQPGKQNIDINIRGVSTLTDNPVLIVIDGIQSASNQLNQLNPNDIESISVLRDAASTTIYGSRAAGGVILVTTKGGSKGEPKFNYSSTFSVQQPTRWAEKVSGFDYAQMHNLALVNDGSSPIFSQSDLDMFSSADWQDHDWEDYLLKNAFQTNQNINVSGGTENHTYYMSVGYLKQDGIVINSDYERYNFQVNQNFKIGDKLDLDFRGSYAPSTTTEPAYDWSHLRWIHGTPQIYPYRSEGKWLETPAHTSGGNAMANLSEDGGHSLIKSSRLAGTFTAKYNFFESLNVQAVYGAVLTNSRTRSYQRILRVYDPDDLDRVAVESQDNFLDINNEGEQLHNLNLLLNYAKEFGDHSITFLAGGSREWFETQNDFVGTRDFLTDNIFTISAGSSNPAFWNISGGASDWALQSVFSRLHYSLKDKYLFEAAFRYDGSSRFTEDLRWGFFPSVSAGWIISQEGFLLNNNVLTFLKLRGSWGQVGNQNVGFYPFANRLSQGAYYFNGVPQRAVATAGAANPLLTWETKEALNFGIEGSIYQNILEFSLDLFYEKTHDILLQLPLPTTFGQAEPVQNAGRVDNRGWEIELRHRNTIGDFGYGISFQISDATNEVIDMGGISPRISGDVITEEGRPMNEWYGLQADGFFQSDTEVQNHAFQDAQTSAGDIRYIDQNNDDIIDSDDRVRLGRSDPRFPFGFRINLNYKDFYFSAFGQGIMKHQVISRPWEASGAVDTYRTYHLDYWTPENPDARFPQPRLGSGPLVGINKEFSSFWIEDAAYFRLKNIEVGYNLPSDLVGKAGIRNARVFVSGENLFTITNYLGYDPELSTGLDRRQIQSRYPIPKLYNVGINLNF